MDARHGEPPFSPTLASAPASASRWPIPGSRPAPGAV